MIIGISRIDSGISGATIEFIDNAYLDPEKFIKEKKYILYRETTRDTNS